MERERERTRDRTRNLERERERPRLQGEDLRKLEMVGAFRIMNRKHLSGIDRMLAQGYLRCRPLYDERGRKDEVISLTRQGMAELPRRGPDGQRYWMGAVKPREIRHDMGIYDAYLKEAREIALEGGRVKRVALDYEFKSEINSRMNREGPLTKRERQREIAAEYGLPLQDVRGQEKVMLPDARIYYLDRDDVERYRDIEVVTRTGSYRGGMMSLKKSAGFSLHNVDSGRSYGRPKQHRIGWL